MEHYTIKPITNHKIRSSLWEIIMTSLIMTGIILSGGNDMNISVSHTIGVLVVTDILIIVCMFLSKIKNTEIFVPVFASCFVLPVFGGNVYKGFLGIINIWISQWNEKYHDSFLLYDVKNVHSKDIVTVFYIMIFVMLAIIIKTIHNKNITPPFFILSVWCLLEIVHGKVNIVALIFLIVSMAGIWMYMLAGNLDRRRIIWLGFIVVLLTFVSIHGENKVDFIRVSKKYIKKQAVRLAYGQDKLPQGNLYVAGKIHRGTSQKRLTIVSGQNKDIYLRGFVGDIYRDGTWRAFYNEQFGGENNQMLSWLMDKNFAPVSQFADYVKAGEVDISENTVQIKNVGANKKYVYAPYSAVNMKQKAKIKNDNGYRNSPFVGKKTYSYKEISENVPAELLRVENWLTAPETEKQKEYAEAEKEYRDFVYRNYLGIDKDLEPLITEAFHNGEKETSEEGIYNVAVKIRSKLKILVSYEKNMDDIPEEKEPVRWFLNESGKGNEALYATLSVLAFRSYGIPARYVEGYLYRGNQNSSRQYTLTDEDAHVWTEVYMDGAGWVPVDTTPGFYYDTYALIQMLESAEKLKDASDDMDNNENATRIVNARKNNKESTIDNIVKKTGTIIYGLVVLFLVIFVIIIVVFILCRMFVLWRYKKKLEQSESKDKTGILANRIFILLRAISIDAQVGWKVRETEENLRKILPGFIEGEYAALNHVLEKFIYGEEELKAYDEDLAERFIEKIHQEITKLKKQKQIKFMIRDTIFLIRNKR